MTNLKTVPTLLTAVECRRVIRDAEGRGFEAMGERYPPSYRNNDRILIDDPELAGWLEARLIAELPAIRRDGDGRLWRLRGLNSRFRVCRYRGGQRFSVHRDGAYAPSSRARSLTTVMVYLNEPPAFAGGRTRFYETGTSRVPWREVTPAAGAALVFDHDLWHDGEAVTRGTKYVLRTDVLYETDEATSTEHRGYVYSLAAREDGVLASGSRDATIRLATDHGARVLRGHRGSVTALAWQGTTLWSGARDGELRCWEEGRHEGRAVRSEGAAVLCLSDGASARPGAVCCGTSAGDVEWWTADGLVTRRRVHRSWVWGLALDGDALVTCSEDGSLRCQSPTRSWHAFVRSPLRAVAVGGGAIVSAGTSGVIHVWGSDGAERAPMGRQAAPVCALAWTSAGVIAGDEAGEVHLWRHGGASVRLTQHADQVRALAVQGDVVVSASYDGVVRETAIPRSLAECA